MTAPTPERLLLKPTEAAALLSVSARTLWSMTAGGEIPAVRVRRCVRYDRRDLLAWIEAAKGGRR